MTKGKYLGIDGCKGGWFFVAISPSENAEFGVFENIDRLFRSCANAKLILIDIPIGLPSEKINSRACDKEARNALKPKRHNSVFSPPCREALTAATYFEACRINQKFLGRKISLQAYHISKKILEVDNLMRSDNKAKEIIRETHPEICFWALAGYKPMEYKKKSSEGIDERLDILKQHYPQSTAIYKAAIDRYPRNQLAKDDILDALSVAITASHLNDNEYTLPGEPEKDTLGLPMEIVYALPKNILISDKFDQKEGLPDTISHLIHQAGSKQRVFPATEYFNETWMLRVVLDWFSKHHAKGHPLSFTKDCRWFSEGLIPSQFLPRTRKDPLGESWTHADGIIGHFQVGKVGRADIQLSNNATHLICIEAKMFSKLSSGVTHARYFDQAARYIACMAEMMLRAKKGPSSMKNLGFLVLAPKEQIDAGVFERKVDPEHIREMVTRRVSEYKGEKDQWYRQWFLPTLAKVNIKCLSWESIIEGMEELGAHSGYREFYNKCLEFNSNKRTTALTFKPKKN